MIRSWKAAALASAATLALGLIVGSTRAHAQAQTVTPANPWQGYATSRAAPSNAYASRPSAWSNYVYRGTAPAGLSNAGAGGLAPRKLAYGYYFNPGSSHWEHPGYGGRIPSYGHAARYTDLPRPWVWWGARAY